MKQFPFCLSDPVVAERYKIVQECISKQATALKYASVKSRACPAACCLCARRRLDLFPAYFIVQPQRRDVASSDAL